MTRMTRIKENERDWDDEKEWFRDNQYCDCAHCLDRVERERKKRDELEDDGC